MPRRKKIDRAQLHAELMQTDELYRRLGERIDAARTASERARFPLGSEAHSREVMRKLSRYARRASS